MFICLFFIKVGGLFGWIWVGCFFLLVWYVKKAKRVMVLVLSVPWHLQFSSSLMLLEGNFGDFWALAGVQGSFPVQAMTVVVQLSQKFG